MLKSFKILFFTSLLTGTMIAVSSHSWLGMWMGLEINLLSITPLLSSSQNPSSAEASIKYFITQVLASNILLVSFIILLSNHEQFQIPSSVLTQTALFIKLGAAPFHAWFPEVVSGLDWFNCLIMLTIQKMAPFVILMKTLHNEMFPLMITISSLLVGGVLGLNQINLRKILAYSSINHIGWMISAAMGCKSIWLTYFSVYTLISASIIVTLQKMEAVSIQQMATFFKASKLSGLIFSLNFMSLGGIPPFLGFLPKWLTIQCLVLSKMYLLSTILVLTALISLIYYLRLMYVPLLLASDQNIVSPETKLTDLATKLSVISIISLPLSSSLLYLT